MVTTHEVTEQDSSRDSQAPSPAGNDNTSTGVAPSGATFAEAESSSVANAVGKITDKMADEDGVTSKVFTIPNIITFIRLCMIPVFFVVLLGGNNIAASIIFAITALTDSLDGYLARATHSVSKLGQILDPFVDRLLMISGVVGLIIVGRLPIWIVILILIRDIALLSGGAWLLVKKFIRIPVIFAGKVVTTLLFIGFAGLLLNWPLIPGLGLTTATWLPGFTAEAVSWGIWFVYAGLVLGLFTTAYYVIKSIMALKEQSRHI